MPTNARKPRGGGRTPSLRGILVVDTTRGNLRVRAWPKPRGKNRHPTNIYWSQWLNAATYLYRYQPAKFQAALQRATEGTPWMPRDIFISALRGRAWSFSDENGRRYYPMAYRVDVSQSLDSIAQLEGQLLVRGESLWMALDPGALGLVLTSNGPSLPPSWQTNAKFAEASINLLSGGAAATTYNVNSTSYITVVRLGFNWDYAQHPFTHFRIVASANATEATRTVTMQLIQALNTAAPVHTGGNDLVVSNTPSQYDSGWRTADAPGSGLMEYTIALKGSNGTVDLSAGRIAVLLK